MRKTFASRDNRAVFGPYLGGLPPEAFVSDWRVGIVPLVSAEGDDAGYRSYCPLAGVDVLRIGDDIATQTSLLAGKRLVAADEIGESLRRHQRKSSGSSTLWLPLVSWVRAEQGRNVTVLHLFHAP